MSSETCCRIESVEISLPSRSVIGITESVRRDIDANNLGRYRRFVDTSLIKYKEEFFSNSQIIGGTINSLLSDLEKLGILQANFNRDEVCLHEITLQFDLPYPELIFCTMEGFRKIEKTNFASLDLRLNERKQKKKGGSKGKQYSFVKVINTSEGVKVNLCFSRKYIKHINMRHLFMNKSSLIEFLMKLGSIYITQATCPECFKITQGFFPYFAEEHRKFINFLDSANWFNNRFKKRNITKGFLGGAL